MPLTAAAESPLVNRRRRPRPESSGQNKPPARIIDEVLKLLCDIGIWHLEETVQAKSAQQQVFVLRFVSNSNRQLKNLQKNEWENAMQCGKNRLVLRIWKGGSRWWNLNRNESPLELARSEIMGYRVARKALELQRSLQGETESMTNKNQSNATVENIVPRIPRVLHFHEPEAASNESSSAETLCWAVLEYVGADEEGNLPTIEAGTKMKIDRSYFEGMIKIRKEFGFDEPHPRWGRVPVDEALDYARSIARQVLLPLHRHSSKLFLENEDNRQYTKTFCGMVEVYRNAWNDASVAFQRLKDKTNRGTDRIKECLGRLDQGITFLSSIRTTPLDPVLLHLDLQPQNLIFYNSAETPNIPRVFSVLDWEDATWGDPRFDLILLCRKVCANRDQADALWCECEEMSELGPIEPWMRLETVHSITTMLLQSMDLVNGGRNPWETKTDLWGKLQREFRRLEGYGTNKIDLSVTIATGKTS